MSEDATYFESPAELRAWLEEHHATASELWLGLYKKAARRPTITWSEAVDEALCFGWIDSKVQSIDEHRYKQRFTPRKPAGNWSAVNIAKVAELRAQGRMTPAGEQHSRRGGRTGPRATRTNDVTKRRSTPSRKRRFERTRRLGRGSPSSRPRTASWRPSG